MTKLIEKLWNWGHLECSHNECTGLNCNMSVEEFADEYGIRNSFIVSYGGNIRPPFKNTAKRFKKLNNIKWSVIGDSSSGLPEEELGDTKHILDLIHPGTNISGAVVDDFFSPERMEIFTPEVLKKIKKMLNSRGLDFWCVLYNNQLDLDLDKYMECFDGVSFWIWECENIKKMDIYLEKLFALVKDKPVMLGVYLWDYSEEANRPMNTALFKEQMECYFNLLISKRIEGVIFCSNTIGDATLETNKILKEYIEKYGNKEIC